MLEAIKEVLEIKNPFSASEIVEAAEGLENIDTTLSEGIKEQATPEGIDHIREEYSNVDDVLMDITEKLKEAEEPMDLEAQSKRIERYKGTIFEDMTKEELKPRFEGIEEKQRTVETVEGDTKPDIILEEAKDDFIIGNTEVKKGEDLFCEVKCGRKEYIESEMSHIEKQVLGHQEGKSVVIVTKDYLEIDPNKRAIFENNLEQRGSSVCVIDISADEVENAVINNVLKA